MEKGYFSIPSPTFFLILLYSSRTCVFVLTVLHFAFCLHCPTHTTNIHAPGGIRTGDPSKRSAADPRPEPLGHWDRQNFSYLIGNRTRDLPAYSAVPQPTAPPRNPDSNLAAQQSSGFRTTPYTARPPG
jgi:hypothetical protein